MMILIANDDDNDDVVGMLRFKQRVINKWSKEGHRKFVNVCCVCGLGFPRQ